MLVRVVVSYFKSSCYFFLLFGWQEKQCVDGYNLQATMECGDEFWPLSAFIMCLLAAGPPWAVSFPDELHLTLRKEIKKNNNNNN